MMNITKCKNRSILNPCTLKGFHFQVDPYIGCQHYCYYCYALNQAQTDWRKEIWIHENITGCLKAELAKIPPQPLYMGWHTDAYQPIESEYRQTRQVLELLLKNGFSASILTKSDLVLRDLDLLRDMGNASVSFSLAFNDNPTRRLFEADTMTNERRIDALCQLRKAGIKTGALLCPVIPFITDAVKIIERLTPCTDVIWIYGLTADTPSARNWLNMKTILHQEFPDLFGRIEAAVFSKEHQYWGQLRDRLNRVKHERQLNLNIRL